MIHAYWNLSNTGKTALDYAYRIKNTTKSEPREYLIKLDETIRYRMLEYG